MKLKFRRSLLVDGNVTLLKERILSFISENEYHLISQTHNEIVFDDKTEPFKLVSTSWSFMRVESGKLTILEKNQTKVNFSFEISIIGELMVTGFVSLAAIFFASEAVFFLIPFIIQLILKILLISNKFYDILLDR